MDSAGGAGHDRVRRVRNAVRLLSDAPRVASIALPLLVVSTSLDDDQPAARLFEPIADVTVLGVFAGPNAAGRLVDLRDEANAAVASAPIVRLSLDRAPGERGRTADIAELIADAIERTGAATVAIGLGVRGGDDGEACDAALLARRHAKSRVRWLVYFDGDPVADRSRVARRRVSLFARGVRLEPVAVSEGPAVAGVRFWEIRVPHSY